MKKPLHLIYVPGLGDGMPEAQAWAVGTWRWWGVSSELCQMNWSDKEPWPSKLQRLLDRIDAALKDGKNVGLVGASAGAGAVINAYALRQDKLVGAVLICGKVLRPETVGESYHRKTPAFYESAYAVPDSLKKLDNQTRARILSRRAIFDETVWTRDSKVPGGRNRISPTIGHAITIGLQIIFGAPSFIRFLKRQAIIEP